MNDLQVFHNKNFGQVRVIMKDGEPWWVAKDVCKILELGNVGQALAVLDDDEKTSIDPNIIINDVGFDNLMKASGLKLKGVVPEAGRGGRPLSLINEPGLYTLVLRSRQPEAKAFKRWITHEVIPAIRKTGLYKNPKSKSRSAGSELRLRSEAVTLRELSRQKIYSPVRRAVFLAEAASMLSGKPMSHYLPPADMFIIRPIYNED